MISFLKKIVSIKIVKSSKKLIANVMEMSELSEDVNEKKQQLDRLNFNNIYENKDEVYISLSSFMELLDTTDLNVDMLKVTPKCKHITEINKMKSSSIEVYSIVEDGHVVLCPDVKTCEKHKGYKGDTIKITTVRK